MRIFTPDARTDAEQELLEAIEADRHAQMLDEIYIDAELLDPEACPPDRRFLMGDREAWVYEHGNICELVFVRCE